MRTTEYTCDGCGATEEKGNAGQWGHYKSGKGDYKIQADFCSEGCHRAWLTRRQAGTAAAGSLTDAG